MFNQFQYYREHVARREFFNRAVRQPPSINRAVQPQTLVVFQRALHMSLQGNSEDRRL